MIDKRRLLGILLPMCATAGLVLATFWLGAEADRTVAQPFGDLLRRALWVVGLIGALGVIVWTRQQVLPPGPPVEHTQNYEGRHAGADHAKGRRDARHNLVSVLLGVLYFLILGLGTLARTKFGGGVHGALACLAIWLVGLPTVSVAMEHLGKRWRSG